MKNQGLLYLVTHSNKEMLKIGMTTSNQRFYDLNRDYQIDWSNSLYFKGENEDIIKMERILHKLFHQHRLDKQPGTGGTEWFSLQCRESVMESILFNVKNSNFCIDLEFHKVNLNEHIEIVTATKKLNKKVKGGYSIPAKLNDELENYIKASMMPKSRVIERAIKEFLEREDEKKRV